MGYLLLIPFLLVRFVLMGLLGGGALQRAAHFPPLRKTEKPAYWLYQLATVGILAVLLFVAKIQFVPPGLFYAGAGVYGLGLGLLVASVVNFAAPVAAGALKQKGLYRHSRNPMYVAYFVFFIGCALFAQSLLLACLVLVFQLAAHWIIRAEERWCEEQFGEAYRQYKQKVRRYL